MGISPPGRPPAPRRTRGRPPPPSAGPGRPSGTRLPAPPPRGNTPDAVGYAMSEEFGEFIRQIQENVPNIHKAVISVHCHDDLGLAVANSLAAVRAGARQIETCVNGIG